MLIIWGFGRNTTKLLGVTEDKQCYNCNNLVQRGVVRVRTWFTLFFIPLIPYSTKYFEVCPVCKTMLPISKQDALMLSNSQAPNQQYAGKTETQIAYLKQMEENDKNQNS